MPIRLKPTFSEWYEFSKITKRSQIPGKCEPGIYLIAKIAKSENKTDPNSHLSKNIIYIGKSAFGINSRLSSWNRSFENQSTEEVGGSLYRRLGNTTPDNLYVSIWPIKKAHGESPIEFELRIMEIEFNLILAFINKYGKLPVCNCELRKPVYHKGKWNKHLSHF